MPSRMPPVPPANRSRKGPGGAPNTPKDTAKEAAAHAHEQENLEQRGRQGNIKQNTTHQGYQQDR